LVQGRGGLPAPQIHVCHWTPETQQMQLHCTAPLVRDLVHSKWWGPLPEKKVGSLAIACRRKQNTQDKLCPLRLQDGSDRLWLCRQQRQGERRFVSFRHLNAANASTVRNTDAAHSHHRACFSGEEGCACSCLRYLQARKGKDIPFQWTQYGI
jgi:hypothetical protein